MIELNVVGRDALRAAGGAHALTDVTGFGLAGHAAEMADGSGLTICLDSRALPLIQGSEPLAVPAFHTRASAGNRAVLEGRLRIEPSADPLGVEYAFDAQTSGGLLIAVAPAHVDRLVAELKFRKAQACAVVGEVCERMDGLAIVLR